MRGVDVFAGAPCIGQYELFDSTWPADHKHAKKLCTECPALLACRELLREEQRICRTLTASGGGPTGTWAGRLVGKPQRRGWKEFA